MSVSCLPFGNLRGYRFIHARALNVHANTITRWLPQEITDSHQAALVARAQANAKSWSMDERRAFAETMLDAGLSKVSIATALNVNRNTVVGWFKSEKAKNDPRRKRAQRMADNNYTLTAIARELNVSRQYAAQLVDRPSEALPEQTVILRAHVEPETPDRLRTIAKRFGLVAGRGENPHDGSIRMLLDAVAKGSLSISRPG